MARRLLPIILRGPISSSLRNTTTNQHSENTTERDAKADPIALPVTPTDDMACKYSKCLASSGYYSVSVGAPLPHTRHGTAAYKLTPSLSYLEHLTMEITSINVSVKARGGGRKQFAMTVHHNKTKASWRHCHSYEDYRRLQERVLDRMEQGHFCMAECPWLYTFLQRSFPKPSHLFSLGLSTEKAIEERRCAILRTLTTLQSVLLNPNNFNCELLTQSVATELVSFLYGENMDQQPEPTTKTVSPSPLQHPWETLSPVATTVRGFSTSLSSTDGIDRGSAGENQEESAQEEQPQEEDEDADHFDRSRMGSVCCSRCALQSNYQRRHILATWRSKATMPKRLSSSVDTTLLSQVPETPRDSLVMTAPLTAPQTPPGSPPPMPEDAVFSPPRRFHSMKAASKRFSLGVTTTAMLETLRQRMGAQPNGSFVM